MPFNLEVFRRLCEDKREKKLIRFFKAFINLKSFRINISYRETSRIYLSLKIGYNRNLFGYFPYISFILHRPKMLDCHKRDTQQ